MDFLIENVGSHFKSLFQVLSLVFSWQHSTLMALSASLPLARAAPLAGYLA
jgi:hypothetical protein